MAKEKETSLFKVLQSICLSRNELLYPLKILDFPFRRLHINFCNNSIYLYTIKSLLSSFIIISGLLKNILLCFQLVTSTVKLEIVSRLCINCCTSYCKCYEGTKNHYLITLTVKLEMVFLSSTGRFFFSSDETYQAIRCGVLNFYSSLILPQIRAAESNQSCRTSAIFQVQDVFFH